MTAPDIMAVQAVLTAATAVHGHQVALMAVLVVGVTVARVATVRHPAVTGLQPLVMVPAVVQVVGKAAAMMVSVRMATKVCALSVYQFERRQLWVFTQ